MSSVGLLRGPVAEWIMHRPPEPETMGSNPIGPATISVQNLTRVRAYRTALAAHNIQRKGFASERARDTSKSYCYNPFSLVFQMVYNKRLRIVNTPHKVDENKVCQYVL